MSPHLENRIPRKKAETRKTSRVRKEEEEIKSHYKATLGGNNGGSSEEGRGADALALGAEERRGKLRKATGSGRHAIIRGCLNGGTRTGTPCAPACKKGQPYRMQAGTR